MTEADDVTNDENSHEAGAEAPVGRDAAVRRTPGRGVRPHDHPIEPAVPEEFGLVQAWWGDGKGKTTAALGMGFRAAGHGFRVHLLQFMKGGASSVEARRGEYNAIAAVPGFTYENAGHYGWHGLNDGSDDSDHAAAARAALDRTRKLVRAAAEADLSRPLDPDDPPEDGVNMLILDEILYAADRELIAQDDVVVLVDDKPDRLELVLTGSHREPAYLHGRVDLLSRVVKERHPLQDGQRARKGTEY